jgi:probable blue pigment (indigoidine) exporter
VAAVLLLSVSMFFFGTNYRASTIGAQYTDPIMLSALRAGPAMLALLLAALVMRRRLPGRDLSGWTALTGLLMVTLALEGITEGSARAGPANAAVLTSASPFFVLIFGWIFLKERTPLIGVLGLVVGFAGGVLMVWSQLGDVADMGDFILGMVFSILTAIGWATGILLCKALFTRRPDVDILGFTVGQYLVGAPVLVLLGLAIAGTGSTEWDSASLWGAVAWLAIGGSAVATLAFFGALKRMSATTVSAWGFLLPAIAVLVEIVYGNTPDGLVLAGMFIAIIGVAIVSTAPLLTDRLLLKNGQARRSLPTRSR